MPVQIFLIILKKYYKNLDIIRLYYSDEFYEAICDVNKDVYKFLKMKNYR